jgi:hypothetical protein
MLTLIVSGEEFFDEASETFLTVGDVTLELEHSLLSLSKWESKFEKAFLGPTPKSHEETIAYVKCMILGECDDAIFNRLTIEHFNQINNYVDSRHSATTFRETPNRPGRREVITAELIYYWMVAFNIPFSCESWHLNRLFSLIRICNIKNSSGKESKMSKSEIMARNQALNAERKARLKTTG